MRRPFVVLAVVAGTATAAFGPVAAVPAALADDPCRAEGGVYQELGLSGSMIVIGQGKAGDGTIYVDDRDATGNGIWIYIESNDRDGLQRGGATSVLGPDLGGRDECGADDPNPDGRPLF